MHSSISTEAKKKVKEKPLPRGNLDTSKVGLFLRSATYHFRFANNICYMDKAEEKLKQYVDSQIRKKEMVFKHIKTNLDNVDWTLIKNQFLRLNNGPIRPQSVNKLLDYYKITGV